MFNRWIEDGLIAELDKQHMGCIVFSPLAQGLLTNKYLNGIPEDSRAAKHTSLDPDAITPAKVEKVKKLNEIAKARRQSLAQMAVAWTLRHKGHVFADRRQQGGARGRGRRRAQQPRVLGERARGDRVRAEVENGDIPVFFHGGDGRVWMPMPTGK